MTERMHETELQKAEARFIALMLGHKGLRAVETWKREDVDDVVRRIFLLAYDPVRAQEIGIRDIGHERIHDLELFPADAQPNPELAAERETELRAAQEFIFNNFKPRLMRARSIPGANLPNWFARFIASVR